MLLRQPGRFCRGVRARQAQALRRQSVCEWESEMRLRTKRSYDHPEQRLLRFRHTKFQFQVQAWRDFSILSCRGALANGPICFSLSRLVNNHVRIDLVVEIWEVTTS